MNILNKVTLQSLKKNKTRTIVTIIGIILSSAMLCAVTTFTVSFQNYLIQNAIYTNGDWHGSEVDTAFSTYESITNSGEISSAVYMQQLGYAALENCSNEFKPYIYLLGASENADKVLPFHIIAGRYPTSSDEILLPEHLSGNGGISYRLGDTLTLELGNRTLDGYTLGQYNPCYIYENGIAVSNGETLELCETRTYTVTGFYERPTFEERTAPGYTAITLADSETTGDYLYEIYFKMKNVSELYSFVARNEITGTINTDLLLYSGISKYRGISIMLYGLAAIVTVLIVFGSISLIYNAFSISVSERTKQFGLLSSIGATKRQLRRTVLFEAIAVSIIGIPIGIISGIAGIGITLFFVGSKFTALGFPTAMKLSVSVSSVIIATAVSLITVLFSAMIPSKRATSVSAVEAIRLNPDIRSREVKTSKLTYLLFGLPGVLASKNYKRSKKKYRATVISLFMSIVLFVSASAFTDYLTEMASDGFLTNEYDLIYSTKDEAFSSLSKDELLQLLKEDSNLTDATYAYSYVFRADMDNRYYSKTALERIDALSPYANESKDSSAINISLCFVSDDAFKSLLKQYGLNEDEYMNPANPTAISIDRCRYFDYKEQKYIVLDILASDDGCEATISALRKSSGVPEEKVYETLTIKSGCTIRSWPFFTTSMSNGLTFVYPESLMPFVHPDADTSFYDLEYMFVSDKHSESYNTLKQILAANGFATDTLEDYSSYVESDKNFVIIIKVFSYGFIVLISLIAAANVFNTISTNIALRRREFAMLKSVGMTAKDFNKMMNFECLLYGSRALLYGIPVSIGITYLIYLTISTGYAAEARLPLSAIGIAVLSVFIVVFITMLYSMSKIKKDNPIDALKNENI